jgi:hypothetical protein
MLALPWRRGYLLQGRPWQVARFLQLSVQPLQGIDSVGGIGFAISEPLET